MQVHAASFPNATGTLALSEVIGAQRAAFGKNRYPSLAERLDRLARLKAACRAARDGLPAALKQDFGSHDPTIGLLWELAGVAGRLLYTSAHLESWMQPVPRDPDPSFPDSRAYVRYQPKGVVGNMAPWNFPIDISLGPLVDILAAGNRAVVKPSELAPACAELVQHALREHFDETEVAVVIGGLELAQAFAQADWDHLIYTGNPSVARSVLGAAAANLTPVTLELGGKCPTILADDRVNDESLREILSIKAVKSGQVCLNTDYVLAPRDRLEQVVERLRALWSEMFPTFVHNEHATGIINERHYDRLVGYVVDAKARGARVVELDPAREGTSRVRRKFPLTLVIEPSDELAVMQNEIFGPILPLKSYGAIDEAIAYVNGHERPLALYLFTGDDALVDRVLRETTSGGVCINSVAVHAGNPSLPFGGIGNSGMGYHHGYEGFQTFSHARAVFHRTGPNGWELMHPPYSESFAGLANAMLDALLA